MKPYNPLIEPDPIEWLAADEGERIEAVRRHHQNARIRPPNLDVHAIFHVIVEYQIAFGRETPVEAVDGRGARSSSGRSCDCIDRRIHDA